MISPSAVREVTSSTGGIEAEAAMLSQPVSMLRPQVTGVRLVGALGEGTTATDLVLAVTRLLRARGVVGRFVEFCGPGLAALPVADRGTLANMAPEYGATCGFFPVDAAAIDYLKTSGRAAPPRARGRGGWSSRSLRRSSSGPEVRSSRELNGSSPVSSS